MAREYTPEEEAHVIYQKSYWAERVRNVADRMRIN